MLVEYENNRHGAYTSLEQIKLSQLHLVQSPKFTIIFFKNSANLEMKICQCHNDF